MTFASLRLAAVKPSVSAGVGQAAKAARDTKYPPTDVTAWLLKAGGVAAVPGSTYDLSPFFRISTAASEAVLADAMDRISLAVSILKRP